MNPLDTQIKQIANFQKKRIIRDYEKLLSGLDMESVQQQYLKDSQKPQSAEDYARLLQLMYHNMRDHTVYPIDLGGLKMSWRIAPNVFCPLNSYKPSLMNRKREERTSSKKKRQRTAGQFNTQYTPTYVHESGSETEPVSQEEDKKQE